MTDECESSSDFSPSSDGEMVWCVGAWWEPADLRKHISGILVPLMWNVDGDYAPYCNYCHGEDQHRPDCALAALVTSIQGSRPPATGP